MWYRGRSAVWLTIFSSFSLVLIIDWISNQRKLFMHYFERSPWVLLLSLCAELLVYFPIHLDGLHFCVFSELSKQLGPYVSTSSCKYLINLKLPVIELGLSPPDIFWMPFYVSFATVRESLFYTTKTARNAHIQPHKVNKYHLYFASKNIQVQSLKTDRNTN